MKIQVSQAKTNFIKIHISDELKSGNTKPLYNFISKSWGKTNCIGCLNGIPPEGIPNSFAQFFSSVYNVDSHPLPDFGLQDPPCHDMSEISIRVQGISHLVDLLDARKASGPDEISWYCIKEFNANDPKFAECLALIYRASLNQSCVPQDWKMANVVPIFKSGRRDLPQNYRPISLTSVTSKMFEHIVVSEMWQHITILDLLSDNKHGFRKRLSTTTQLLDVIHHAAKALSEHKNYHFFWFHQGIR